MGNVSMEFCGGTHLDNTAKVGLFRIKSEGSVASGVRRIEAITGKQTLAEIRRNQERIVRVAQMLKTTQAELESKHLGHDGDALEHGVVHKGVDRGELLGRDALEVREVEAQAVRLNKGAGLTRGRDGQCVHGILRRHAS